MAQFYSHTYKQPKHMHQLAAGGFWEAGTELKAWGQSTSKVCIGSLLIHIIFGIFL